MRTSAEDLKVGRVRQRDIAVRVRSGHALACNTLPAENDSEELPDVLIVQRRLFAALLNGASSMTLAVAAESVTVDNFARAETHFYMKSQVDAGCFGTLCHQRGPAPVDRQAVIRLNRDTPYSQGVFDLTSPVTITMPDAGSRFQTLMVINEDHFIKHVSYAPGPVTLTRDSVGSRYAFVFARTFMDGNDPADMRAGAALQDRILVAQASQGSFDVPDWNQEQRMALRTALLGVARFMPDAKGAFGDMGETDPVRRLLGTAGGWGGNREEDAVYVNRTAPNQDGKQAYTLTIREVPVDGFWSVTVYNAKGYYEAPENAISVNNVTARTGSDGAVTLNFGGDPGAPNHLNIMPGWNYTVRLYRPRADILDGTWKLPEPVPAR
jgi:hypothetical protein